MSNETNRQRQTQNQQRHPKGHPKGGQWKDENRVKPRSPAPSHPEIDLLTQPPELNPNHRPRKLESFPHPLGNQAEPHNSGLAWHPLRNNNMEEDAAEIIDIARRCQIAEPDRWFAPVIGYPGDAPTWLNHYLIEFSKNLRRYDEDEGEDETVNKWANLITWSGTPPAKPTWPSLYKIFKQIVATQGMEKQNPAYGLTDGFLEPMLSVPPYSIEGHKITIPDDFTTIGKPQVVISPSLPMSPITQFTLLPRDGTVDLQAMKSAEENNDTTTFEKHMQNGLTFTVRTPTVEEILSQWMREHYETRAKIFENNDDVWDMDAGQTQGYEPENDLENAFNCELVEAWKTAHPKSSPQEYRAIMNLAFIQRIQPLLPENQDEWSNEWSPC